MANPDLTDILAALGQILEQRKRADPGASYVAALYSGGLDAICAKLEEETAELIEAARTGADTVVIHEAADLWFHTLVLLAQRGLEPGHVLGELRRRYGRSGLDEKAARITRPDGADSV